MEEDLGKVRFASFDVETTGTDVEDARIIEMGIVVFEAGEVVQRYQQLIDPGEKLSEKITEITGITDADLSGMPTFSEAADAMMQVLSQDVLLAYNHEFDVPILKAELRRAGRSDELAPCLDPLPFCWEHLRKAGRTKNAKLGTVSEFFDISLENAHRAEDDAEAAGRVMYELPKLVTLPSRVVDILSIQRALMQSMKEDFARFRRGRGDEKPTISMDDVVIELGAAWLYGDEPDPVRALFKRIPDVRDM